LLHRSSTPNSLRPESRYFSYSTFFLLYGVQLQSCLAVVRPFAALTTPGAFDKYLAGDDSVLTVRQKAGLAAFIDNGCADCHSGPLLGGGSLELFGMVKDYSTATGSKKVDLGRFEDTKQEEDKYVFRVSMLRNVAKTGPYFHDGSVEQLSRAVQVMADVQLGVELSAEDNANIVEFLDSLTGAVPEHFSPLPTASEKGGIATGED
jgi:cytochrome c peroxidase